MPALCELVRAPRELRVELADQALLPGQDLLVTAQALELARRLVAEREHRRFRIAVFPLEARERVEPLVDGLEPAGRHRDALPQGTNGRQRVLDQRPGAVDRIGRRGERRIEPCEIAQQARHAMEPAHRGAVVVVQEPRGLGEAGRQSFGVLEPPALDPQLVLLARPQPRAVELRYLQAQEILALSPIALGGPRLLELGLRGAAPGEEVADAVAELFGLREAVQEVELSSRLEQALVFVLAVDLDQMVAEALEQAGGHRRVVDERAMAAGSSELAPNHELPLLQAQPGLLEHRRDRTARRHFEDRLDGG